MKKFAKEFSDFVFTGNTINFAVGVIIGSATTQVVNSLVTSIFMPIISAISGKAGVELSTLVIDFLGIQFQYGIFLNALFNFILTAFVLFVILKFINSGRNQIKKLRGETEEAAPEPVVSDEAKLLQEILAVLEKK